MTKSSQTTSYDYGEDGLRIIKTTPSNTTVFMEKYTELRGSDVVRHVYANDKLIASIDELGDTTYNHSDHISSSNLKTDASGSVVKRIEYFPFGDKRTQSGSYNNIKNRFTGQFEDEESDLYYYQQRYYDPILSRFITADPLYLEEMNKKGSCSQQLNLYAYTRNNPIIYLDPNGLDVYTFARSVNMSFPASIGNHQFSVSVPDKSTDFRNLVDVGGGKQGIVIGAYNEGGVLKAMANAPSDLTAAREYFNNIPGTTVQAGLVSSGGLSDSKHIGNILSGAENFNINTAKNPIAYPSNIMNIIGLGVNITTFNQSLLNAAGSVDFKTDFKGFDSGSARSIDDSYFQSQTSSQSETLESKP